MVLENGFSYKIPMFFFGAHITKIIGSRCTPATALGMTLYQEVMQDLLAKMVLCAPTTWFQVVTGHPCILEQESYDMDGFCFLLACVEPYRQHCLMSNVVVGLICLIRLFLNGGALRKS